MSGIFINYRRGDEPGFTGRLFDRLESAFSSDQLFMDVDSIPAGLDFVSVLEQEVDRCDVLLAVIGRDWSTATDGRGNKRLHDPKDFVRIEIESALRLGKRVIPVLVNKADMPNADDLPDTLKPLARRNAVRLTHDRFKSDSQGLIKVLEEALKDADRARTAKTESDRIAADVARKLKAAEEEARSKQAEVERRELVQEKVQAGMDLDGIRKAEELANWDFVRSSKNVDELRNHIARFPGGVTHRYALHALEEQSWSSLGTQPSIQDLDGYLAEFPRGYNAKEALALLQRKMKDASETAAAEANRKAEVDAWAAAAAADTASAYEGFLERWPASANAKSARARRAKLKRHPLPTSVMGTLAAAFLLTAAGISYWYFEMKQPPPVQTPPATSPIASSQNSEAVSDREPADFIKATGFTGKAMKTARLPNDACFKACRETEGCVVVKLSFKICSLFSRQAFDEDSRGSAVYLRKMIN